MRGIVDREAEVDDGAIEASPRADERVRGRLKRRPARFDPTEIVFHEAAADVRKVDRGDEQQPRRGDNDHERGAGPSDSGIW